MWQVLVGGAVGGVLGMTGGFVAPRWLPARSRAWEPWVLAAVTAGLGGLLAAQGGGLSRFFWHQILFFALLTTASLVDLHAKIIPNELVLAGLGIGVLLLLLPYDDKTWVQALLGGALAFGSLLILALIARGGMGMGDVKLGAVIGLFVGYPWVVMALFSAFVIGGIVGLLLLVLRLVKRKDTIPFGPYLALGAIVTILYGPLIWAWYNPN